jgi:WD40 repeat protein
MGGLLGSGGSDATIRLWDVATGRQIATLKGHDNYVHAVAFAPDGKTLASGSRGKTIKIWDLTQ